MGFGKEELIVPDTSVLISKKLTGLIDSGQLKKIKVLVPEFVIDELQAQANKGKEIGFLGLEEIKELRKRNVKLEFVGRKPTIEEIKLAKKGRIDALIRELAQKYKATLYTKDFVQALVAEVFGVKVKFIKTAHKKAELEFLKLLTKDTMSLHFKVNCIPLAKRGHPGKWELKKVGKEKLSKSKFEQLASSILKEIRGKNFAFVEFEEYGAMVLQIRDMRISITRPPFSDAEEITIVRPIVKLNIDDYELSEKLKKRITDEAGGILISGPPGSGKSTLAASLAEFYQKQNKIVKTMEQPRDLQVNEKITQYAPLAKSFAKTAEILLLVRPDYTIFDEIRTSFDFKIFSDLRLAGVGMVGVIHASRPIDSIQRFVNKVELGMLHNIVDTIIFVKDGKIEEVYSTDLMVRVPTGMRDSDLARPLMEIRSFETGKLEYEIYSFGEETIVIPIEEFDEREVEKKVKQIKKEINKYDKNAVIEHISGTDFRVYINKKIIAKLIGRGGKGIDRLETKLKVHLDILER